MMEHHSEGILFAQNLSRTVYRDHENSSGIAALLRLAILKYGMFDFALGSVGVVEENDTAASATGATFDLNKAA